MDALEAVLAALEEGPEHVSAVLLAFAVKRELLTMPEAEKLAEQALENPQTICEALAPLLEEAGLMSQEEVRRILGGEPS